MCIALSGVGGYIYIGIESGHGWAGLSAILSEDGLSTLDHRRLDSRRKRMSDHSPVGLGEDMSKRRMSSVLCTNRCGFNHSSFYVPGHAIGDGGET
jgi:hypothetical protein